MVLLHLLFRLILLCPWVLLYLKMTKKANDTCPPIQCVLGRGKVCVHIVLFRLHLWNYRGYVVIWYSKQLLWFTKYFRKTLSVWICILPSVVLLIASQILVDVWTCDLKSTSWFQIPNSSKSRIFGFPIWKSLCKPWLISLYLVK